MIKKLLIVYLFTINSVMAGLPTTTLKGQSQATKPTTFNFQVPNKQATITAASTGLIETGNNNELENAGFEHSTVTTGWTISNATSSSSTTRIEGGKSLSLALTGALSLSQSSTINASQKSGVQMVASVFVNSSDVSDLQLCSLKNGAEDKCTATGGYVQGTGWRLLTVSFLGDSTSNGLKLKSTDTSGTVLVDQAFVGIGSPVVDFTPDMVFSAKVSSAGVVSDENTDWINGNVVPSGNQFPISFVPGLFTTAPNCTVSAQNTTTVASAQITTQATTSGVTVATQLSGAGSAQNFQIYCQKQGADYKTSKAYVASSSDTDWASYTPTFTGFGTPTNVNFRWKREGSDLLIDGYFTSGTTTATEARISFPNSVVTSSSAPTISVAGFAAFSAAVNNQFLILKEANNSYMTFGIQNASNASLTKFVGNSLMSNGQSMSLNIRIPIQGWTDSGVIVGSFQGYNETPGTSRVETFSVSYGTTNATTVCSASPCSYLDQIGNAVMSITRSGTGAYTINTSKTYSKLKCQVGYVPGASWGSQNVINCSNCNSASFQTVTTSPALADSYGTLLCQGVPQ